MKTFIIILLAVIPFTGSAVDTVTVWKEPFTNKLDLQWSGNGDGYTFRQFSFSAIANYYFNGRLKMDLFAYQVPDDFLEFGVGPFYDIISRNHFTLTLGGYISSAMGINYAVPAVSPSVNFWRFSTSIFLIQYIPLDEKGKDQTIVFPFDAYFRLGGFCNLQIGVWSTWYDAEGLERSKTRFGPSVKWENWWGKTRIHVSHRSPQHDWIIWLRHTFQF